MKLTMFERAISVKRDHESWSEMRFVAELARTLNPTMIDGMGNLHFDHRARHSGDDSTTLFVAHTDTITRGVGPNKWVKDAKSIYYADGDTLGADDAAGIALLCHLMQTGVPGYYIFCRGEEAGGIGSQHLAEVHSELLSEFDRAIAFDRRGFSDVVTHQGGSRCASDEFGEALSTALNDQGLLYMPCPNGVFTDTANWVDLIPECTNISCGYDWEHSPKEWQDGVYLSQLGDAVVRIDWDALPTKRELKVSADAGWGDKLPQIWDATDKDIVEAWQEAIDKDPRALMQMVAKQVGVSTWQIDREIFSPAEVYAAAIDAEGWYEVIDRLAAVCEGVALDSTVARV